MLIHVDIETCDWRITVLREDGWLPKWNIPLEGISL